MTNLDKVKFRFSKYGNICEGFFFVTVIIDNEKYRLQCCINEDGTINFDDCGYDWGLCHDYNKKLADKIGWENLLPLLEKAYKLYTTNENYSN